MLHVENISKHYTTGDMMQTALDGVTLSFRKMNLQPYWAPAVQEKLLFKHHWRAGPL